MPDRTTGSEAPQTAPPPALERFAERVGGGGAASDAEVITDLDAAAAELFSAFARAGVPALLLKGPALARMLYEAGELRAYSDVDVLVSPQHLERARNVLARLGYTNAREHSDIDGVGRVVHAESWLGRGPRSELRGAPGWERCVVIELHGWFPGSLAAPEAVWRELFARRTELDVAGSTVAVLNRVGLALHLATHAAQHGPGFAKGLRELQLGLERWPDEVWAQAVELAAATGATECFAAGLRLVPAGEALARTAGLPHNDQLDWEIRNASARPRGTFHLDALSRTRRPDELARLIGRSLLPSTAWMRAEHPWVRTGPLRLLAAYALHVLRAPMWAARAWSFRRRARQARSLHDA